MANNEVLSDKMAVLQVIGSLIKKPSLFLNASYKFHVDDFPEQFHKIVFASVEHLASNGVEKIAPIDIDQYLAPYTAQYRVFSDNKGFEYVSQAINIVNENNFDYYYQILKKFSLLNQMSKSGFDITPIYDTSLTDPKKIAKMQDNFNGMTLDQLLGFYEGKIISLKQQFGKAEGIEEFTAGDGIFDTLEDLKETPEMGLPLISPKLTTICRGRRLKKFYIESSAQGMGKSRRAAGESCKLAVPDYFNTKRNKWEKNGFNQSVLLISTELELQEVQTMWLAYISGVPEDKILDNNLTPSESERVQKAAEFLSKAKLFFVQIADFGISDIENIIKKYHSLYGVSYVFYDYLSSSMKIMSSVSSESRTSDLKEWQILNLFGRKLKVLCNVLGIHLQTATQLSGSWKTAKEADTELLRGAKSLADQPDIASIMLPVREMDKPIIETYLSKGFELKPNMVIHVYKVRRGKYNNIKLYVYFDKSTCRMEDCFATDNDGILINIEDTFVEIKGEQDA